MATDYFPHKSLKVCLECPLKKCAEDFASGTELDLSTVSRVEVARAVHVTPEHIGSVFLGKTTCSLPLAYEIAKHLGCTIDNFFKATTGANGKNPMRRVRSNYTVDGKSYQNMHDALIAAGYTRGLRGRRKDWWHYDRLPDDLKARIVRNRPHRGR